jgi:hypothetical protein
VLSQALDHPNRIFQLVHVMGLLSNSNLFDEVVARAGPVEPRAQARLRVEFANYFAAAVLMPYAAFLAEATAAKYDFDRLATLFGVSFEQACHRATTMQREGAQGVPFFFMRIDKAGNVTKRFNATDFHLAEFGGACPRLDVHTSFRTPGKIVPQFVEMPDKSQYFVFSRTVDRPIFERTPRTTGWPWRWGARSSMSAPSAMPRPSPCRARGWCRSGSTAGSARGRTATSGPTRRPFSPSPSTSADGGRPASTAEPGAGRRAARAAAFPPASRLESFRGHGFRNRRACAPGVSQQNYKQGALSVTRVTI